MTYERARSLIAQLTGVSGVADGEAPLVVSVEADHWPEVASFAKYTLGCEYFSFSSAIDWKAEGLEVIVWLDNIESNLSLLLKTRLGPGRSTCPSLCELFRGADWMERECYDMFGIQFDGHPDLRRILLPDDWEGYPLLKSYAVDTPHPPYR